uniref:GP-PDE domain-containing protein n=1 Tax=Paramoeba aestuarina TaxID=180227 RepID=A0A7S4N4U6_9EUKA
MNGVTWLYIASRLFMESAVTPNYEALQTPMKFGFLTITDQRMVNAAHARNVEVQPWTINTEDEMKELLDMGVDGIMTDRIDLNLVVLGRATREDVEITDEMVASVNSGDACSATNMELLHTTDACLFLQSP